MISRAHKDVDSLVAQGSTLVKKIPDIQDIKIRFSK
jgi:hypothetical protein